MPLQPPKGITQGLLQTPFTIKLRTMGWAFQRTALTLTLLIAHARLSRWTSVQYSHIVDWLGDN